MSHHDSMNSSLLSLQAKTLTTLGETLKRICCNKASVRMPREALAGGQRHLPLHFVATCTDGGVEADHIGPHTE